MQQYSQEIKDQVRALRVLGLSLNQIYEKIRVPKTTIREWIKDITLTEDQQANLKSRALQVLQAGRVTSQRIQREKRVALEKELLIEGREEIGLLNNKNLFIAGIALYWAEGFKNLHERRLGFCNSDSSMVRFYVHWLEACFQIDKSQLIARLTLNKTYESKTKQIERYWSETVGIPLNQFTKPFYQNTIWKKQFNTDNYHGVLRVHVKDSLKYILKMRGWIEGLRLNLPG